MNRDKKYIFYIGILLALLAYVFLSRPARYDWSVTYSHQDKNPYGTYAFAQLLPRFFSNHQIRNSYKTLYELKDSLSKQDNLLIISSRFSPDKEDTKVLFTLIESGATAFISADHFGGILADTLGLETADSFFQGERAYSIADSAELHFVNSAFDTAQLFSFRRGNIPNYFSRVDSVQASVIAQNDFHQPVTIRIKRGKGNLILNTTPMMFTNIYLMAKENHQLVANSLSYLPANDLLRTEYYHLGRLEVGTPLRFILTTEPLRWAYYITIVTLLFFIVFEAKRRQRIIPLIKPLSNTTLEFVATIGNLYFQRGDHKNIAEKKIQFFFEYVHSHYRIPTHQRDAYFVTALAGKSGVSTEVCERITQLINQISGKDKINKEELITLNGLLDKFQLKK